jgi:RHS repeat-associated protein
MNRSTQPLHSGWRTNDGEDSFGKVTASAGSLVNPFQYTGREMDSETGLYYYRARYYDPTSGRFLSEDPAGWAGGNNFFRYAGNNSVLFNDPSGYWPTKVLTVHQNAIDRALSFLPAADRDILKQQQVAMDADQSVAMSYKHCMRAPGQCIGAAMNQANDWLQSEIQKARAANIAGNHQEMLRHMGNVIHTLQDCTSPAHTGFQVWQGDNFGHWISAAEHVNAEFYDPGPGSALDNATLKAWNYLTSGTLPSSFF